MPDIFSYGTPEEVGISSRWIENLFRRILGRRFLSHSIVIARHGKVVSEGYFAPFRRNDFHRMYSTSKSFVSTAIGMLIGEGKLSLDDRIVRFFPDKVREPIHPWVAEMTVRDLLVMATPFTDVTYSVHRDDWVDSFFTTAPSHPSGTYFHYDTSGSFILDVIVERITGKPFLRYLWDVLLSKTGFSENAWCVKSPDGYSWGGSGVQCTTLDLARLAQVYLDHGMVNGEQVLPRDYAEAAVSRQIDNNVSGHIDLLHGHGYGYQIWRTIDGFGLYGMGGQLAIVCPRLGLLMAATSDEQGSDTGYHFLAELFFRELVDQIDANGGASLLPSNPAALSSLRTLTESLACPIPLLGQKKSDAGAKYYGVTYRFREKNTPGLSSLSVTRDGAHGVLHFHSRGEDREIRFGFGQYDIAPFPETSYFGDTIRTPKGSGYRTMSAALWTEENKLVIRSYLIDDYFGNLTITLAFKDKTVAVLFTKAAEWFLDEYKGIAVGEAEGEI